MGETHNVHIKPFWCGRRIEACRGAKNWTRELSTLGHEVAMRPARSVKALSVLCAARRHHTGRFDEALLLGRASCRMPSAPRRSIRVTDQTSMESLVAQEQQLQDGPLAPCPFLQAGRCRVYELRPMACRTLLNLDDDDHLCRHADGVSAEVPYADATKLEVFALMAQAGKQYADIREFFLGVPRI